MSNFKFPHPKYKISITDYFLNKNLYQGFTISDSDMLNALTLDSVLENNQDYLLYRLHEQDIDALFKLNLISSKLLTKVLSDRPEFGAKIIEYYINNELSPTQKEIISFFFKIKWSSKMLQNINFKNIEAHLIYHPILIEKILEEGTLNQAINMFSAINKSIIDPNIGLMFVKCYNRHLNTANAFLDEPPFPLEQFPILFKKGLNNLEIFLSLLKTNEAIMPLLLF